jgi:hypothetical protein
MSVGNAVVGAESALLDKIRSVMDRVDAKTTELQNSINEKIRLLPGFLQDKVVAGWNRFCGLLRNIWGKLSGFLAEAGSVTSLWDTADAWSERVGAPVSGEVQNADAGYLTADDNWSGSAADAYRQTLPMQKTALDKVKSALTDGIASALNDVASSIMVFWTGLLLAFGTLVVGLIGALGSSATIFGLPAAPIIAAGAGLVASLAIIAASENLKSACSKATTSLHQKLADNSAFSGGHWPPAVEG